MSLRPTHTFSIVARDPATGALGVAVQTHWFAVGSKVPWLRPGVGAVATQSMVNMSWGPKGLDHLAAGRTPQEAIEALKAEDPGASRRQIGMIDAKGESFAFTGEGCIAHAGHRMGKDFSVQANLMKTTSVIPSMVSAWESSAGTPLAERLMAVLRGAQAAGGDIRGKQSAALMVGSTDASAPPWDALEIDLRVEDHANPIEELSRLLGTFRAYEHMTEANEAMAREDYESCIDHYQTARDLLPGNVEIAFWHGLALARSGDDLRAIATLRTVFQREPDWLEVTRRLADAGILDQVLAARILSAAAP